MKKLFALVLLLIGCTTAFAEPIKQIVFFGDSLTDNGNLHNWLHVIPRVPPYFEGRFSNGNVWADNIAKYYQENYGVDSENYALGGASVILFQGRLPVSLGEEVDDYYTRTLFSSRLNTLYVIWSGANDYLGGSADVDGITTRVVDQIGYEVSSLITERPETARNFLIINMPDLANTPEAQTESFKGTLHDLSVMHNQKLAAKVAALQNQYKNVKFVYFDAFKIFNDVIQNVDQYNKEFNMHISNVSDSCWTGGYFLKSNKLADAKSLSFELKQAGVKDRNGKPMTDEEIQQLATQITNTPALAEPYRATRLYQDGVKPCADPDAYIFWDKVHPTAVIHKIISNEILQQLLAAGVTG